MTTDSQPERSIELQLEEMRKVSFIYFLWIYSYQEKTHWRQQTATATAAAKRSFGRSLARASNEANVKSTMMMMMVITRRRNIYFFRLIKQTSLCTLAEWIYWLSWSYVTENTWKYIQFGAPARVAVNVERFSTSFLLCRFFYFNSIRALKRNGRVQCSPIAVSNHIHATLLGHSSRKKPRWFIIYIRLHGPL